MRMPGFVLFSVFVCAMALSPSPACAAVRLPALFSDHMILQRDVPVIVWGWADPSEQVTVCIAAQEKMTQADASGDWQVTLAPIASADPLTLAVSGTNKLVVKDVLAGEVWICSGQSNMGVPLSAASKGEQEVAAAQDPQVHFFTVAPQGALEPASAVEGRWQVCSPQTASQCTAVGYFFARELRRQSNVPVGLIHSSVGGSPIEGWIERKTLDSIEELRPITAARFDLMKSQPEAIRKYPQQREQWETRYNVRPPANKGQAQGWAAPDFDDHDWPVVTMPAAWAEAAGVTTGGVFWLRKDVVFPGELAGKACRMNFNFMHGQTDRAYFNGVEVGQSGDEPPLFDMSPRRYDIPGKLVRSGKNVIALRIVSANPQSDLLGAAPWRLRLAGTSENRRQQVATESRKPVSAALGRSAAARARGPTPPPCRTLPRSCSTP